MMIESKRQATIRGQYMWFAFSLRMSAEDVLSIAVENTETLERYSRAINREYISQQEPSFQAVFKGASDVYDYLKTSFHKIVVNGDALYFNHDNGNCRVRRINIQLLREIREPVELEHLKAAQMREPVELKHLKAEQMRHSPPQLFQKDIGIAELIQKYENIAQTLLQMKEEMRAEKTQSRQLVKTLRADFQSMKDELQVEKAKNRELEQTLKTNTIKTEIDINQVRGQLLMEKKKSDELAEALRANYAKSEIELTQIKRELYKEKDKSRKLAEDLWICKDRVERLTRSSQIVKNNQIQLNEQASQLWRIDHHPSNDHREYYKLTNLTGTSARIIRIGKDKEWYNFVNECQILPNQNAKYSLTIHKTKFSEIKVGFCSEQGLGNINNFQHVESAYYYCRGFLWQSGSGKQDGLGTNIGGETTEYVVELSNGKFSWWKKGSQIAWCAVPAGMRNKPIFISILLFRTEDEVDLCVCSTMN